MTDWTAGYVLDVPYTSNFFRELAPSHLSFAALMQGIRPPDLEQGGTYCELGCGQGFGTNLLAAANPHLSFWGFDFNPSQIANARRLAAAADLGNVTFRDESFEEARDLPADALPEFDVIALHGTYTWISRENRRFIVEFIDRRLKPGGLVYVSYNCMPGCAPVAPLQRLLWEHASRHPDRSDNQADAALEFAQRLREGGALYFAANPRLAQRVAAMPSKSRTYLAHEYLNEHWYALHHLEVAREFEAARLTYVASANIAENIDVVSVPEGVIPLLEATRDRGWQETIRDFASNKQFRRDIFMRGVSPLTSAEKRRRMSELRLALTTPPSDVTFKFRMPVGEFALQVAAYRPMIDALAAQPRTLGELVQMCPWAEGAFGKLLEGVSMLVHAGHVTPAPFDATADGKSARRFNLAVAERARLGEELGSLAVPASGSGIPAAFPDLLTLLARQENQNAAPRAIAEWGWSIMEQNGQRLRKDGQALEARDDNIAVLESSVATCLQESWPIWRQLGVV